MADEAESDTKKRLEATALAWLLEHRAGLPSRGPHQPPDMNDPAVAEAVTELYRQIVTNQDKLAAIGLARGMTQAQRREALLASHIEMQTPEAAVGRYLKEVYLKLFADGVYKIGETGKPDDRPGQLQNEYRVAVHNNKEYLSPLAHELEQALLDHFVSFRVRRGGRRELVALPLELVGQFEVIAAKVEQWVFNREEARLKLEVLRLETECEYYQPRPQDG